MPRSRPRLVVVSEYFHPEEASTAQLLTDLATGLTDRFDVGVVTGRPSYLEEERQESVPRRETVDGVAVERVPATRFDKDILPLRLVNWLSYTVLALWRLLRGHRDADAALVLSNPPILPLAVWLVHRVRGTPYVYLVYDVYPDMAAELGHLNADGLVARLWARAMRPVYRDAERVVVLGDAMADHLDEKLADEPTVDESTFAVIPNWADGESIRPQRKADNPFAREQGTVDDFTVLYSGNVGRFHELETTIDAIERLEARGRTDVQLLIIGAGARKEDLQATVDDRGIENVRFLPFQPLDRLPDTLTCADASLVGIKPGMAGLCVSAKLYTSLAAGMPVLAVVGEGDDVARTVERCDSGVHVEPGDAETVAEVLETWADDPERVDQLGRNARDCFESQYTKAHAIGRYGDLFEDVVAD